MQNAVIIAHNVGQIVLWSMTLWTLVENQNPTDLKTAQYWDPNSNFKNLLAIAQSSQIIDFIFAVLGVTKNKPASVLLQLSSRIYVTYFVFPFVTEGNPIISFTTLFWCIAEIIRFSYYSLQLLDLKESLISNLVGHLRYNAYIVNYPCGITGELISCYDTWLNLKDLEASQRPWSI